MEGDAVWIRDKIVAIERELGGYAERHRALEQSDQLIRSEVRDGFSRSERMLAEGMARLTADIATQHAHMRGEIDRLVRELSVKSKLDEDRQKEHQRIGDQHHKDLVSELRLDVSRAKAEAAQALSDNRRIIALVGIAIVLGNVVIEHMGEILAFLG